MNRRRIFAANWKMHHGPASARAFLERFLPVMPSVPGRALWFFTPGPSIEAAALSVQGRGDVSVGAQNVYWEPKGAFTGEISGVAIQPERDLILVSTTTEFHVIDASRLDVAANPANELTVLAVRSLDGSRSTQEITTATDASIAASP